MRLGSMGIVLLLLSVLVAVSLLGIAVERLLYGRLFYNAASLGLMVLVMIVFHFIFSPVRVGFRYLLSGALVTAFLWLLMRPAFNLFLAYNPGYGITFGSLKAVFIVVIWLYYSFGVLLFGAEVVANLRRKDVLLLRGLFYEAHGDRDAERLKRKFGRAYKAGETIFKEGEPGEEMFYVLSGSVGLGRKGQAIKTVGKGGYFGEMALLLSAPRAADAIAGEDGAVLISISQRNFETLLREEPKIAVSILKELAMRLKNTDELLDLR